MGSNYIQMGMKSTDENIGAATHRSNETPEERLQIPGDTGNGIYLCK